MPPVSERQRRAMWAAKEGRSTLGIPKKIGAEFVAADSSLPIAAGIVFVGPDGDVLLLKRAGEEGKDNYVGHWALPGGKADAGETPEQCADREAAEELGLTAPKPTGRKKLLDQVQTPNGMMFYTFAQPVEDKFQPKLNEEHSECGWFPLDKLPQPMHPNVTRVLGENLGMAQDMAPEDWTELRENFAKWTREEEAEPEHAEDVNAVVTAIRNDEGVILLDTSDGRTVELGRGLVGDNQPTLATALNTGIPVGGKIDGRLKRLAKRRTGDIAQDSVCGACEGAGCDKCGGSGVAPLTKAPMKPGLGDGAFDMAGFMRGLGTLASDEGFNEGDHPRAPDGKFGAGSGGKGPKSEAKGVKLVAKGSTEAKGTLKMDALKKTGGKLGSNEGGSYEDHKGAKYYIKKAPTKAHADNERAAARLYQLAGAATLPYLDVEGGQHIATEWRKLEKKNISEFTPAERKEAAKDFAIHAWLSNWDAAGTGGDNQGVLEGKTTTLDVGGSLRFRAQGGPKGGAFGDKVTEFDTLRDKGMNPDAARLFAPMTEAELSASVERVTKIPDAKIREAVGDDKELADRLIARKKNLANRVGVKAMDAMFAGLARDSRKVPEHTLTVRYDGDFSFKGLLTHLQRLGSIGASRTIQALDEDDKVVPFGWDGDGADKIWDAEIDGEQLAFDRAMVADMSRYGMAFDRSPNSVRKVDKDGHMLVESSIITGAAVNDYLGDEIPGWKGLGLEPKKIYALYRTEEDLAKGAQTLHGKPLLLIHKGVTADTHPRAITVGSVINPIWENPNLSAELSVWDGEAISLIESGKKKSLSAGYRYVPVMQAGVYKDKPFVGKMTAIEFNHLALVTEPRFEGAGVGDSAIDPWALVEAAILRI